MKKLLGFLLNLTLALLLLFGSLWFIGTQPLFSVAEKTKQPDVSPQILQSYVRHLSETLPAREGTEANLIPTIDWIEQQIKPYGKSYRQSYQADG